MEKALMAPAVSTARKQETIALAMGEAQKQALAQLKAMAEKVRENADYVGDKFAEEARKIHFGETDPRGIYGEATLEEAKGLAEDGVDFMPIPVFPDDRN
ncbi:mll3449 [Mesorhizobium japonicum MAFF 303099]|uniref:Mll3449 protein n=1 Tax=Mesorhizobium japonicum (strain LMG 29417 / CECT 9101 / MAFF 303099) TaxID=266835 RepID=Q98G81_RHILO|nr:mll3449 [Mesorhizobium japonicum MAFF 303099]